MKNGKILIVTLIVVFMGAFLLCACSSNNINGTYIGEGEKLFIYDDGNWTYHNEDNWVDEDYRNLTGSYSKVDSNTYKLESDKITFYADINNQDEIYVYSDNSDWKSETFKKISSEIETEDGD